MKPKFFRGRPIIQPGETYEVDGVMYKVITATARILEDNQDTLGLSKVVYWLDNVKTGERTYVEEKEFESKFKEEAKVNDEQR